MCGLNFLHWSVFFFFCEFFTVDLPYSLNITINCNNKNTNESSLQSCQLVNQGEKLDDCNSGGFWSTLYSYKRCIFLIMVGLYFSQFMNFQLLKNGFIYVKNKIVRFFGPSKVVADRTKKASVCLLCQKKHSFFTINFN